MITYCITYLREDDYLYLRESLPQYTIECKDTTVKIQLTTEETVFLKLKYDYNGLVLIYHRYALKRLIGILNELRPEYER